MHLPGPAGPELLQGAVLALRPVGARTEGYEVRHVPLRSGSGTSSDRQGAGFGRSPGMLMASNGRLGAAAALTTILTSGIFALAGAQMSKR